MNTSSKIIPWDQRLARVLILPMQDTQIHPNHLTTLTLILGQSAALVFAMQGASMAWLGALLYMLAVFSDHMDGELARLTGKTSKFGHNYDYIVGGINYTTLFIAIGYGLYQDSGLWLLLVLGLAAGFSNPFILYLRMSMEIKHGNDAVEHPSRAGFEIEDFIYLIGPITWIAGIHYFFIPYALGTLGYFAWTIIEFRRLAEKTR